MTKLSTVIEDRFHLHKIKQKNDYWELLAIYMNFLSGLMLPFVVGYYLAITHNLLFLLLFILMIFVDVRFSYKNEEFKVKIVRWF